MQLLEVKQEALERFHSSLWAQAVVSSRKGNLNASFKTQEPCCDRSLQQLLHTCTVQPSLPTIVACSCKPSNKFPDDVSRPSV